MRRKSWVVQMLLLLSLLVLTAACGGGGGGGAAAPGGPTALATGTFTKPVEAGADNYAFSGMFATSAEMRYMMLLTAADIKGSGYIRSLRYNASTTGVVSSVSCTNVTIKMGATTVSALTTTFADNVNQGAGTFETVLDAAAITIPVTAVGAYYNIDLTKQFYYNGKDNLVIEVTRGAACSGTAPVASTTPIGYAGLVYVGNSSTAATGTTGAYSAHTELVFAGGDNTQDYGGAVPNSWPFTSSWGALRTQNLYLASDINGSGPITGIAYQMNATSAAGTYTYSMTLSHAVVSTLSSTLADNYSGTRTTVASAVTFTVPAGIPAGEWFWVPIPSGTFTYNGTDNLIVEVLKSSGTVTGGNDVSLRTSSRPGTRVYTTDGTIATGTVDGSAYHIKFRFNGGRTMVLPSGGVNSSAQVLGSGMAGQLQSLYPSTLLGTSGTINNVYVRLYSTATPTAASLTNYKLYMGHSVKTGLTTTDTYASNMDENATVLNGTLTIPAGLKAGDWVKIPLSSPFAYNSGKNLCILFTTDAGPAGNSVSAHAMSSVLTVGRNDNSVTTGGNPTWTYAGVLDLALDISK